MARPAYSLDVLLGQLNTLAPNRSKASDGWIGDAAHAGRVSDHNPDLNGIVHARDFTHDPAGGLDCNGLAGFLTMYRDPRIKYIIWNHKIWNATHGWLPYNGANPHTLHLHLSVHPGSGDNRSPWTLGAETMSFTPNQFFMQDVTHVWSEADGKRFGIKPDANGRYAETHSFAEWYTVTCSRVGFMLAESREQTQLLREIRDNTRGSDQV